MTKQLKLQKVCKSNIRLGRVKMSAVWQIVIKSSESGLQQGKYPPATLWRGPTTDSHGDFWLLGFPPGPFRHSLVNLLHSGSPEWCMSMQALVRTLDQHVLMVTGNPHSKPSNRTCLQVAGLQGRATAPGWREVSTLVITTNPAPAPSAASAPSIGLT